jgi:DNA-3-methyladenine glycosylase II
MNVPPSDQTLADLRAALAAAHPALARAHAEAPPFSWRVRPGGFVGLLWMIVGQQVSLASAAAIWARVEAGLGEVTPQAVLARGVEGMRSLGLSLPKARYAVALSEAEIDWARLSELTAAEAHAALAALKGVGRWTAEVYLMFCDARPDVFPAGDIALQEALRWAHRLDARPTPDQVDLLTAPWAPHRSTAAHLLWAWYGAVKRGEVPHPMKGDA